MGQPHALQGSNPVRLHRKTRRRRPPMWDSARQLHLDAELVQGACQCESGDPATNDEHAIGRPHHPTPIPSSPETLEPAKHPDTAAPRRLPEASRRGSGPGSPGRRRPDTRPRTPALCRHRYGRFIQRSYAHDSRPHPLSASPGWPVTTARVAPPAGLRVAGALGATDARSRRTTVRARTPAPPARRDRPRRRSPRRPASAGCGRAGRRRRSGSGTRRAASGTPARTGARR